MIENLKRKTVLWVSGAYGLIVSLMTLPDPLRLSRRLIGDNVDSWIFYWNDWWLGQAIRKGHNWFVTPYLFYPQETNLVAHSISYLNSLLAALLEPLLGPLAAYNLVFLLGLWIGAMGMFLLIYEMTQRTSAAFIAGFVFAFTPYHLTQYLSHIHLGSIHWWPFFALFLYRALRERRVRDALYAGLFAALTVGSGFQLALLLGLWSVPYIVWRLCKTEGSRLRLLALVGLIGVVGLVLSAPLIVPVVKAWPQLMEEALVLTDTAVKQTDLLAYLVPPRRHTLLGPYVTDIYERFIANKVASPYLGFAVIGLSVLSLIGRREGAWFWVLTTGLWIALAAGTMLRVNGTLYPHVPMPYDLVKNIPLISTLRAPDRFNLLVALSLPISAGLGAAYVAQERRWVLVPVGLLILIEFLCIPLPAWELPQASPFFAQMADDQDVYGVVDYPMHYTLAKRFLYYQTLHGKPSVDGHYSRYSTREYTYIASQPLLRVFYQSGQRPGYLPEDFLDSELPYVPALGPSLRSLESSNVRYILVHKPFMNPTRWTQFYRVFPGTPVYDDETLAVYDIANPLPFAYDGLPVHLTPGAALARFDIVPDEAYSEWRFQVVARLVDERTAPLACRIQLAGENKDVLASPLTLFGPLPEDESWMAGDLQVLETVMHLQDLDPGDYHWSIACPQATTYTAPETLTVSDAGQIAYLRHRIDTDYGDVIRLQGYRWRTPGAELLVTLRWETLEPPGQDYKVFVHLLDSDGEIARQHDSAPCDWQCPTGQWQKGELVLDQSNIYLGGLEPGDYRLAVGLYDAQTGERLAAVGPDGQRHPDDYVFLPDVLDIRSSDDARAVFLPALDLGDR